MQGNSLVFLPVYSCPRVICEGTLALDLKRSFEAVGGFIFNTKYCFYTFHCAL